MAPSKKTLALLSSGEPAKPAQVGGEAGHPGGVDDAGQGQAGACRRHTAAGHLAHHLTHHGGEPGEGALRVAAAQVALHDALVDRPSAEVDGGHPEPVDRHLRPDPDDRAARRGQWHSGPPGADRGAWGELGDHVAAHEGLDEVGDGASRQAGRLGDLGARDGRLRLEDVRKDESEVVLTDELLPGWLGAPGAARAAAASACGRGALRRRCPRHVATR
ncbi:MAG TPA: hypothetical protein PLP55_11260 [Phycicoccus elongatus]|uniref:hypothetical protein n=1 Tax=Phycicoccus TaxID=367298 RepID=UPI002588543E|nr:MULTISPECIES: hypothetical protein [Phycicoccus]MCB9405909.1 hypothetical protein [Tetrasphaera sp.]MCO5302832.1 hypothetical protein [Phycicoccus sp.]HPK13253.1 hypothetical protein [Phycicoccus elongatus]